MRFTNTLLSIIAVLLAAIVAKLYVPAAQDLGPRFAPHTLEDILAARDIDDRSERRARLRELARGTPIVWVDGGDVDVSGSSVEVTNTVEVEGEVSLERD